MPSFLELPTRSDRQVVELTADRLTVGSDDGNDLAMLADRTVSRQHAVLERFPAGWCVRDLGSRNGTFVNGRRLWQGHALRDGDEIQIGATRLVYRTGLPAPTQPVTAAPEPPPDLTRRERDVLVQLCRPALAGDLFTSPATSRDIADALVVTEAAVKQHLLHLYDKFGIASGEGDRRRVRLANEAIRRQAVTLSDLR